MHQAELTVKQAVVTGFQRIPGVHWPIFPVAAHSRLLHAFKYSSALRMPPLLGWAGMLAARQAIGRQPLPTEHYSGV